MKTPNTALQRGRSSLSLLQTQHYKHGIVRWKVCVFESEETKPFNADFIIQV